MVFLVQHIHERGGDGLEVLEIIDIYSSRALAEEAVSRLKLAPGFCDSWSGFSIDEYEKNADHWVEGLIASSSPSSGVTRSTTPSSRWSWV
jgi:hypothetical protein